MSSNQIKIMLCVNSVKESNQFRQALGFTEEEREGVDGTLVVEIAPSEPAETIIVLYGLVFIQRHSPEVTGNIPPLMFANDDIIGLYRKVQETGVTAGEMVQLSTGLVFNFADNDDNYSAVMGQESR